MFFFQWKIILELRGEGANATPQISGNYSRWFLWTQGQPKNYVSIPTMRFDPCVLMLKIQYSLNFKMFYIWILVVYNDVTRKIISRELWDTNGKFIALHCKRIVTFDLLKTCVFLDFDYSEKRLSGRRQRSLTDHW